ncbi:hypothetical protein NPIL_370241 [Nephila pilipes]|uniref:Uncharacterized protein n=1 Tax=Nephila pilipes TaxID=299642 RepID=A0A8X6NU48_NEPPI|nr:hypothetical protein NPIL_370241 [Nephila pilipes]
MITFNLFSTHYDFGRTLTQLSDALRWTRKSIFPHLQYNSPELFRKHCAGRSDSPIIILAHLTRSFEDSPSVYRRICHQEGTFYFLLLMPSLVWSGFESYSLIQKITVFMTAGRILFRLLITISLLLFYHNVDEPAILSR